MKQKCHVDNNMRVVNFYGDELTLVFLDEIEKDQTLRIFERIKE